MSYADHAAGSDDSIQFPGSPGWIVKRTHAVRRKGCIEAIVSEWQLMHITYHEPVLVQDTGYGGFSSCHRQHVFAHV